MFCGHVNIPWNILPHSNLMWRIFHKILLVPQNSVMDLNIVMLHQCFIIDLNYCIEIQSTLSVKLPCMQLPQFTISDHFHAISLFQLQQPDPPYKVPSFSCCFQMVFM